MKTILLILIISECIGADIQWVETLNSEQENQLDHPSDIKYVYNDSGKLVVEDKRRLSELPNDVKSLGGSSFMKVNDRLLIGVNNGEWGGHLLITNGNTSTKVEIGNVVGFTTFGKQNLVFTGIAHLVEDKGIVWNIQVDPIIENSKVIKLPGSPTAWVNKGDQGIMVACYSSLLWLHSGDATSPIISRSGLKTTLNV